jgi:hypothetical protein
MQISNSDTGLKARHNPARWQRPGYCHTVGTTGTVGTAGTRAESPIINSTGQRPVDRMPYSVLALKGRNPAVRFDSAPVGLGDGWRHLPTGRCPVLLIDGLSALAAADTGRHCDEGSNPGTTGAVVRTALLRASQLLAGTVGRLGLLCFASCLAIPRNPSQLLAGTVRRMPCGRKHFAPTNY